jgi:hypothetical protein
LVARFLLDSSVGAISAVGVFAGLRSSLRSSRILALALPTRLPTNRPRRRDAPPQFAQRRELGAYAALKRGSFTVLEGPGIENKVELRSTDSRWRLSPHKAEALVEMKIPTLESQRARL